jgi:hypothetical protein
MNKQFSLLLHSILISGTLFVLMPASPLVQPAAAATTHQTIAQPQPDVMLISFGRGVPRSRSGGGTR